jgi:dihydrofolate synthase/folylpolyglutamate synthase
MINYGGYETALSFIGHYAACNAAIAVELALGLCNKGIQIEDEAILAGLAAAENRSSIRILCRRPLLILDACHTPQQVRALTNVLRKAKLEHLSAVVGLSDDAGCDAFFAALETGFLDEDKDTEKNRMPGMADNPFDKVYLVTPPACTPAQAKRIAEKAKFHFDITVCETLADAAQQARADKNHGVLICGGEEIVRMAEDLLQ